MKSIPSVRLALYLLVVLIAGLAFLMAPTRASGSASAFPMLIAGFL